MDELRLSYSPRREENGTLYVEYRIDNQEISHIAYHGVTLPINGSIEQVCLAYLPTARSEIMKVVDEHFPGDYY